MYSNIVEMDRYVGVILKQLEEDGLLENTVIAWYGDHGGPLPRQKRLLYDSGLRVPLIVRYPGKRQAGEVDERLISFVDFAPTLLSRAGIGVPDFMQGRAFDGASAAGEDRRYVFAAADRFDGHYDMIRAVRDARFKYLRNYRPEQGYYLPLNYREQMAAMQELLRLRDAGALNPIQAQWFRTSKPEEELFDTANDPHELNNLAGNAAHRAKLEELRQACLKWMVAVGEQGFVAEDELIERFWPGRVQPVTAPATAVTRAGMVVLASATRGASIGYRLPGDDRPGMGWRVYSGPLQLARGERIETIAHRLGYAPSEPSEYVRP